jgi:hypothetical protein
MITENKKIHPIPKYGTEKDKKNLTHACSTLFKASISDQLFFSVLTRSNLTLVLLNFSVMAFHLKTSIANLIIDDGEGARNPQPEVSGPGVPVILTFKLGQSPAQQSLHRGPEQY